MSAGLIEFRPIPGHPQYLASSDGKIWTFWRSRGPGLYLGETPKELTGGKNEKGYRHVILCDGKKNRKMYRVSRLILEVFSGPCPEGMECSHKDGNKLNNAVSNLEWATHKDNNDAKREHGTHQAGSKHGRATLTEDQVRAMRLRHSKGEKTINLAKEFNQTYRNAWHIITGKTWRHVT